MARRRRRYKHRSKKYWSGYHRSSHNKLHAAYGGLEYDIQSIFFRLDEHTLNLTLRDYEKRYGYGAREYAARTFTKWRSGQVGMSGTVLQRFIHLVPPHLSFKLKFDLLVKAASQNKNSIKVYVPVISTLENAIQVLTDSVNNALWNDLPSNLKARLSWLESDDFQAAKALLKEAVRHEAAIASGYLRENLNSFSKITGQVGSDANVQAEFNIHLLGSDIQVVLTNGVVESNKKSVGKERNFMSENGGSNPKNKDLAKPVEDPNNLLNEALQKMPEGKYKEVVGKAADEALRLQVKRRESEDDVAIVNEKLRQAARFSEDMQHSETSDYEFSQTHRSEQGDARITVSRKTESKKFCFVATACFDDIDHPIVSRLRRLRDERLAKYVWGQKFINWYYRNGEELADSISKIPGARTALKPILWFIAYTFTLTSRD
jgi:hypothetical protein